MFYFRLLLAFILPLVSALKFDISADPGHESQSKERCIRNFVQRDQLVVVTAKVSGFRGDGQTLNIRVSCSVSHPAGKKGAVRKRNIRYKVC